MGVREQTVRVRVYIEQRDEYGAYPSVPPVYSKEITVNKHYSTDLKVEDDGGVANYAADTTMKPVLIALKSEDLPVNFKFGGVAGASDPNVEFMLMVNSTGEYVVSTQPAVHVLNDAPDVVTPAGGNDAYPRLTVSGDEV
jgi:hypothetical protein